MLTDKELLELLRKTARAEVLEYQLKLLAREKPFNCLFVHAHEDFVQLSVKKHQLAILIDLMDSVREDS